MNLPLYSSMIKLTGRTMLGYAIGSVLYLGLLISLYPTISGDSGINGILQSMPLEMQRALGVEGGIHGMSDYVAAEYYGLLFLLILMIFCVSMAVQVLARLVDQGAMAALLATPVSRTRIAGTQALVLLTGLFLICLLTTLGGLFAPELLLESSDLDKGLFLQMNLIGFLLFAVVCGYSFFFSCLFNDEKQALGAAGGVTLLFFAMNLVGKMSEELTWLKNLSLFNLFQPQNIMRGEADVLLIALGLGGAALLLFGSGILLFKKRDLPL